MSSSKKLILIQLYAWMSPAPTGLVPMGSDAMSGSSPWVTMYDWSSGVVPNSRKSVASGPCYIFVRSEPAPS